MGAILVWFMAFDENKILSDHRQEYLVDEYNGYVVAKFRDSTNHMSRTVVLSLDDSLFEKTVTGMGARSFFSKIQEGDRLSKNSGDSCIVLTKADSSDYVFCR